MDGTNPDRQHPTPLLPPSHYPCLHHIAIGRSGQTRPAQRVFRSPPWERDRWRWQSSRRSCPANCQCRWYCTPSDAAWCGHQAHTHHTPPMHNSLALVTGTVLSIDVAAPALLAVLHHSSSQSDRRQTRRIALLRPQVPGAQSKCTRHTAGRICWFTWRLRPTAAGKQRETRIVGGRQARGALTRLHARWVERKVPRRCFVLVASQILDSRCSVPTEGWPTLRSAVDLPEWYRPGPEAPCSGLQPDCNQGPQSVALRDPCAAQTCLFGWLE
jgi:hypothetical protein